jgi:hypothetical protein
MATVLPVVKAQRNTEKPLLHVLKTDPEIFDAMDNGQMVCGIRLNDRNYRVGDSVLHQKTTFTGAEMAKKSPLVYTGDELLRKITHIVEGPAFGVLDGWVVLSFAPQAQYAAIVPESKLEV